MFGLPLIDIIVIIIYFLIIIGIGLWAMRLLCLLTLGDFFEERYGSKSLAGVYAIIGSIGLMAILAVGFTAITKTVAARSIWKKLTVIIFLNKKGGINVTFD